MLLFTTHAQELAATRQSWNFLRRSGESAFPHSAANDVSDGPANTVRSCGSLGVSWTQGFPFVETNVVWLRRFQGRQSITPRSPP